jgi:hypothetical protein
MKREHRVRTAINSVLRIICLSSWGKANVIARKFPVGKHTFVPLHVVGCDVKWKRNTFGA